MEAPGTLAPHSGTPLECSPQKQPLRKHSPRKQPLRNRYFRTIGFVRKTVFFYKKKLSFF